MDSRAGLTFADFDRLIEERGWVHFPQVLDAGQIADLCHDCQAVYELCRTVQIRNGVSENMEGTAHHLAGHGGALDRFLEEFPLTEWVDRYFDGKWILLNYGAALNPPGSRPYTCKPHRDVRAFTPGYPMSLNMLVMLADFTVETGATLILSGSHRTEETPPPADFFDRAERLVGKAGDIVLFNSLTVHAAAPNRSDAWRPALTLCLGRPFMKPQMDWPRYLPAEFQSRMTDKVRQIMGFNARVAASLDEYYQPPERWTFRADQR